MPIADRWLNDAGYTLVEMLVALAILGLSIGGLSAGMAVIARLQSNDTAAVRRYAAARLAQTALQSLLDGRGAFRTADDPGLVGDADGFQFPCGASACRARLGSDTRGAARLTISTPSAPPQVIDLDEPGPLTFSYLGRVGSSAVWPTADMSRQALRAVALLRRPAADAAQPIILEARVWSEQPADCAFDPQLQDCR